MLFVTNLMWNSFTSQNSKTHALLRLLRYILIYNLEVFFNVHLTFPASRGLSRRGKNERKEGVFASSWETSASREHLTLLQLNLIKMFTVK